MCILVPTLKQMAVLMLNLSHDFHSSPLVHFVRQSVLVGEIVPIPFFLLERIFVKFSGNCLATNVGSDCAFVVNKALNNWNHMGKLCANIHNQTTLQSKKIC